jgi:hypothetical protein
MEFEDWIRRIDKVFHVSHHQKINDEYVCQKKSGSPIIYCPEFDYLETILIKEGFGVELICEFHFDSGDYELQVYMDVEGKLARISRSIVNASKGIPLRAWGDEHLTAGKEKIESLVDRFVETSNRYRLVALLT